MQTIVYIIGALLAVPVVFLVLYMLSFAIGSGATKGVLHSLKTNINNHGKEQKKK